MKHAEHAEHIDRAERRGGQRGVVCAGVRGGGGWLVAGGALPAWWGVARVGGVYPAWRRYVLGVTVAVIGWCLVVFCGE